jgi:DNA ligase-1
MSYSERTWAIYNFSTYNKFNDVVFKMPIDCGKEKELFDWFIECETEDGEGICFRTPNSPYKQGRSTLKEQYLVKLTRMLQSEAIIIGMEEAMENINPRQYNAVGAMDRSSCKHNLVGKNTLGALIVRDIKTNQEFKIGTGFDDAHRIAIWKNQVSMIGKIVLYKHKPHGQKLLPRCPSFKGFRKESDIV